MLAVNEGDGPPGIAGGRPGNVKPPLRPPIRAPMPWPTTNDPVAVTAFPFSLADGRAMIGIIPSSDSPQPVVRLSMVGAAENSVTAKWRHDPETPIVSGSTAG